MKALARALLGTSTREPGDPGAAWGLAFEHEALKLERQEWVRPASRLRVTYTTVLSAIRLVLCWRVLGSPAELAARELLRSACQHCRESRPHHLRDFWPRLKEGVCDQAVVPSRRSRSAWTVQQRAPRRGCLSFQGVLSGAPVARESRTSKHASPHVGRVGRSARRYRASGLRIAGQGSLEGNSKRQRLESGFLTYRLL